MDLREKFFLGLGENFLYITTCIEKHCTWPLSKPEIYFLLKNLATLE